MNHSFSTSGNHYQSYTIVQYYKEETAQFDLIQIKIPCIKILHRVKEASLINDFLQWIHHKIKNALKGRFPMVNLNKFQSMVRGNRFGCVKYPDVDFSSLPKHKIINKLSNPC